jgi:vitamin B12 transporter
MLDRIRAGGARTASVALRATSAILMIALPLVLLPTPASAQQSTGAGGVSATELPQVLVSGSRLPSTPSGLAQNVTVIDQLQIQESAPASVEDLLGRVAGVYVDRAGKAGGFSSLYMRGAENSHLLVMIDGIKVNDPTTTRGSAYDLSSIDVSQIERVEVLRGPASAIHGGEALAGVVNIITKRATQPGVHGGAYGALGQEGYQKVGGTVSVGNELLRGQLSVGHSRDGSSGADDGLLKLNSVSGSLRVAPSASVEGELFVHKAERKSEAFPDDSGGPRLAVNREKTRRDADDLIYGANLAAGDANSVRLQAGVSVYERKEDANNAFIDGGVRFPVPGYVSDTDFKRTTIHATATRNFGALANVVVGLEQQREDGSLSSIGDFDFDGNPDNLQFNLERRTNSVFAEARIRVAEPVSLQVGLRRDKVQGLDAETTPHLGAVWDLPNRATTLKANYSEGFKPPSFFALGFPIGGNPNLRPERSKNAELTLAHRFDGEASSIQLSVFQIDYTDLVDFTIDPITFAPLNVNRGKIVVKGVEPTLKYRFVERLKAQLGATILSIEERDGLAPLRNRPEKRAHAGVIYEIDERSSLSAVAAYTGRFLDRSNPTADIYLPGYATVDAAYSIRFGSLSAKVAIDNLLDRQYEQFVGFPSQDRRLRVEIRAAF